MLLWMDKKKIVDIEILKKDFHKEMIEICKESKKIGYNPSRFIEMLAVKEGYLIARTFMQNPSQTDGFTKLWEKKRLDLTVENTILKDKYIPLFSHEEREVAKKRLSEHDYKIFRDVPLLEPVMSISNQNKFKKYTIEQIAQALYEYMFEERSHRYIDEKVLSLEAKKSLGYQTMAIFHYLGIKSVHKGIFKGLDIQSSIMLISHDIKYANIKFYLENLLNTKELEIIILEDLDSEKSEEDKYYKDGLKQSYYGNRYERNPINRRKAIEIHGLNCIACGFNFEKYYGKRGKDFIEVHHLKPVSQYKQEEYIDPSTDLVPVCSNCHRMIHRRKDSILSIEELKLLLQSIKIF